MAVEIDPDRFRDSFDSYSAVGATDDGGLHRLTLSDADRKARDSFVADCEDLGLDVRIDELGNIFARREGNNPDAAPVMIGSHLDSQPFGGRYDGQLGVLTALETLRAFEDAGIEPDRPIELVNWTNEEGSRFEQAMMGSGVWAGAIPKDEALSLTDGEGKTVAEELERIGYAGDVPCEPHDVHAYLELHVEQGPQLERAGDAVGVVEGVFGMSWLEATIHGEANHAGPTTMPARRDALATAAEAASRIHTMPNRLSADAVATVGRFEVEPNSINVIPDEVTFTIDVRSYDDAVVDRAVEEAEFEIATAADREGTTYDLAQLWKIPHTEFSPVVREAVADAATAVDAEYQHIVSGAGHDANRLNTVTDAGMIFVPSVDGITHSEAEYTEWSDCVAGARVYANATLALASE